MAKANRRMGFDPAELREFIATLKRLPPHLQEQRKQIIRKAAKPFVAAAQSKAPVLRSRRQVTITLSDGSKVTYFPNNLRLAIKILPFRKTKDVFVGPQVTRKRKAGEQYGKSRGKVDAFYSAMLEYGTRNMGARPYMRPAWEATRGQVLESIRRDIEKAVTEFGRKNAV